MSPSISDLYSNILSLSEQIDSLSPNDAGRKKLEDERDRMRSVAATIAAAGRHPKSVENEIETIERRLEQIDALLITEGYTEKRSGRNLQDPGAYSSTINRLLTDQHADEVASLTERLKRLRSSSPADDDERDAT